MIERIINFAELKKDNFQAVNEMKEFQLEGAENKLVVCRAQKKSERQAELKRKYEMQKVGGKLTIQI